MSKVESFYWNKLSSKSCCFELEQFFDLCFVLFVQGAALITSSTYIYCVVIQKEFSRKVGINKVKSFYWNKINSKRCSFESEQFYDLCPVYTIYCVVIQKEFSRKVGMSKVESFYWNKLSSKSCCFDFEQIFDLCFVLVVQGATLITSSIYDYCVVIQKEFSRKVGMNNVESFYWNKLSSESCFIES